MPVVGRRAFLYFLIGSGYLSTESSLTTFTCSMPGPWQVLALRDVVLARCPWSGDVGVTVGARRAAEVSRFARGGVSDCRRSEVSELAEIRGYDHRPRFDKGSNCNGEQRQQSDEVLGRVHGLDHHAEVVGRSALANSIFLEPVSQSVA